MRSLLLPLGLRPQLAATIVLLQDPSAIVTSPPPGRDFINTTDTR
jgi:hypothetical protein